MATTADMDVDAATAAGAAVAASSSASRVSFGVLQQVRLSQAQNGLKHGDYARYRCVRGLDVSPAPGDAQPREAGAACRLRAPRTKGRKEPEGKNLLPPQRSIDRSRSSSSRLNQLRQNNDRTYCTRRLRSLYKGLRFLHGKGRYAPRKLDPSLLAGGDARFLQIPLVLAERAWAVSMELKREVEAGAAGDAAARKRQHALSRAAKAARWSGQLAALAAACGDTRTALEAEAYSAFVAGGHALDRERDWPCALASFQKARRLLRELARVGGDLDAQAAAGALADECEPPLRYCQYQLDRAAANGGGAGAGAGAAAAAAAAAASALETQGSSGAGGDLLSQKLAALAQEAAREQELQRQAAQAGAAAGGAGAGAGAPPASSVEWRGQAFVVRPERARVALAAAAAAAAEAAAQQQQQQQGAAAASAATDAAAPAPLADEAVLAAHDRALNAYAETRAVVRALARAAAAGAGDKGAAAGPGDADELSALEQAVSGLLLERQLGRGELAAQGAARRMHASLRAPAAAGGPPPFERGAKPEDLVRLFDGLAHAAAELSELSSGGGGGGGGAGAAPGAGALAGRAAEALVDAAAARGAAYAAWRCYYTAHAYLASAASAAASAAGGGAAGGGAAAAMAAAGAADGDGLSAAGAKAAEAAALFRRAGQRADDAAERLSDLPKGEAAARALLPSVSEQDGQGQQGQEPPLPPLPSLASAWAVVAAAEAAAADAAAGEAAGRAVGGLALGEQNATTAAAATATLADAAAREGAWESYAGGMGGPAPSAAGAAAGAGAGSRASRAAHAAAPPRLFPLSCPIAPPMCAARPVMLDTAGGVLRGYPDVSARAGNRRPASAKLAAGGAGAGAAAAGSGGGAAAGSGGGAPSASTLGWAASKLLGAFGGAAAQQ